MINNVTIHDATLRRASVESHNDSQWISLIFWGRDTGREMGTISVFSRTPEERADHRRIADGINNALDGKTNERLTDALHSALHSARHALANASIAEGEDEGGPMAKVVAEIDAALGGGE